MNGMQVAWLVGGGGQVGQEIIKQLNYEKVEILSTDIDEVDITDAREVMMFADMNRPHYIINCAGYTDVTLCEENPEKAYKVNAIGARNLSVAARKTGARMIQLSTDDVFDGKSQMPYNEFDTPNPKTVYGKSKLAGENFVRELTTKHIIIRSSWIYGDGVNYVKQVLDLTKDGQPIEAAYDQVSTPTSAKYLAAKILHLMEQEEDGIFHITCNGTCSRYEFAKEVLRLAGRDNEVVPVSSKEDALAFMRPKYSVLDNMMLRLSDIELLPDWKACLEEYIVSQKA